MEGLLSGDFEASSGGRGISARTRAAGKPGLRVCRVRKAEALSNFGGTGNVGLESSKICMRMRRRGSMKCAVAGGRHGGLARAVSQSAVSKNRIEFVERFNSTLEVRRRVRWRFKDTQPVRMGRAKKSKQGHSHDRRQMMAKLWLEDKIGLDLNLDLLSVRPSETEAEKEGGSAGQRRKRVLGRFPRQAAERHFRGEVCFGQSAWAKSNLIGA